MVFNSIDFVIFFIIFYPVFLLLSDPLRKIWLLAASWFFYFSFKPEYLALLLFLTAVDFYCGRRIYADPSTARKRLLLFIVILCNVGVLFVFKYLGFFSDLAVQLLAIGNPLRFSLVIPIGISFHTFQGMSYAIDIYRGRIAPEKNFKTFALYISIFPQLVSGPIERAWHMIPQLKEKFYLKNIRLREALFLIFAGYIKKMVIADNLAVVVNKIYGAPHEFGGVVLAVATLFFGFQLYCDFSGYIDIARGIGKLLGIDFVKNFQKPYFSGNITEFWRRWHISLSSWVRDYIYIPLGGNRKGQARQYMNLVVTMVIMGFWHGAGFNFMFWGAYHGVLLALHKIYTKFRFVTAPALFNILTTFAFINIGWIFFRSGNINDALYVGHSILMSLSSGGLSQFHSQSGMMLSFFLLVMLVALEFFDAKFHIARYMTERMSPVALGVFFALAFQFFVLLSPREPITFIYSQF